MAQVYQLLVFIASAFSKDGIKVPTVDEALRSFALPAMAEAMKREEEDVKARSFYDSVIEMAKRTGGNVEISKGGK